MEIPIKEQDILIHVDPRLAVIALSLAKLALPAMIKRFESQSGLQMDKEHKQQLVDTLDEIYEQCVEQSDVQDIVDLYMRPISNDVSS